MADSNNEPVTRRECDRLHSSLAQSLSESLKGIADELSELNGSVAENTKFRVQSKAIYGVLIVGWGLLMAPLTAVLIAVLK